MGKKIKTILFPVILIAVCIAVVVTVLILTLSGKGSGSPHIVIEKPEGVQVVRGELEISLKRERLETVTIRKETGLPTLASNNTVTDFSAAQGNIFGLDEIGGNNLIGPQCYFSAEMSIQNLKPYSFEYWLEITPENGESLLVDQLELTVTVGGETYIRRTLQDGLTTKVFPTVKVGETAKFNVKLEYLDLEDNDNTKNTTMVFDLVVHARLTES